MKTTSPIIKAHTLALSVIFGLTTMALSTPAISGVPGAGGAGEKPKVGKIDKKPKPAGIIGKGIKKIF